MENQRPITQAPYQNQINDPLCKQLKIHIKSTTSRIISEIKNYNSYRTSKSIARHTITNPYRKEIRILIKNKHSIWQTISDAKFKNAKSDTKTTGMTLKTLSRYLSTPKPSTSFIFPSDTFSKIISTNFLPHAPK